MGRTIHGHAPWRKPPSPEYRSYHAMKTRCLNENSTRFHDYGARGISICARWLDGENGKSGFECFLHDMGPKPSPEHTVGRLDNDKGYTPNNCAWSTSAEQARNSRATRWVEIEGQRMSFAEAVERFGRVTYRTARQRVQRGMPDVDAITTPLLHGCIKQKFSASRKEGQ